MCQLTGDGIEYIGQVSVDGGKSWHPGNSASLQTQASQDGTIFAKVPLLINKKRLQIKLRDFPKTEGLLVTSCQFFSSVKASSERRKQSTTQDENQPVPNSNPNLSKTPAKQPEIKKPGAGNRTSSPKN